LDVHLEVRHYQGSGRHYHDHVQILFPLRGAMQVTIEAQSGVVASRCVAVIPTGFDHSFVPSANCSLLVLDVGLPEAAGSEVPTLLKKGMPFLSPMEPWLWRIFRQIGAEVDADGQRARDAAKLALSGLHLIRPAPVAHKRSKAVARIERLVRDLDAGAGEATVSALARDVGLGQSQFHALFKGTTGSSPRQFRIDRRLEAALERLATTADPVSEIAYAAGYENASSFNRIFKRRFGVSPSTFRTSGRMQPR
jgi:AraC-like DNA-binding protein